MSIISDYNIIFIPSIKELQKHLQGELDERNSRENHGKQVSLEIERTAIKDNVA